MSHLYRINTVPHSIALKGPWQVTGLDAEGNSTSAARLVIRKTDDWDRWWAVLGQPQGLQAVQFERAFNWPSPDRPAIELVIDGSFPRRTHLNEVELTFPSSTDDIRVRVEALIEISNRLRIEFCLNDPSAQTPTLRLLSDVTLWIQDVR